MTKPTDEAFEEGEPRRRRRPTEQVERADRERRRRSRDEDYEDYEDYHVDDRRERRRPRPANDDALSTLIPYRNGQALAAYYCGVFSLIPLLGVLLGPIAIILGILGNNYAKANPEAKGTGHAITGIILGSIGFLICGLGPAVFIVMGMLAAGR
jgi:4-hydroxybenzoate polyprenyltransferase